MNSRRAAGLVTLLLAGCGGPPPSADVSGTVTLNGKPLADGTVTLIPDGPGTAATGSLKDGRFAIPKVPLGPKRVSINATRPVAGNDKALAVMGGGPATESILPDEYNASTKLRADVTPGGPNEFKFDLTVKP